MERFNGELPSDIESLTSLAGVGRKTANVVRTHIFHIPSIVVDTHVKRISNKLGFTDSQDPVKIEFELMRIFQKNTGVDIIHRLLPMAELYVKPEIHNVKNAF